jgi:hypothetical protein
MPFYKLSSRSALPPQTWALSTCRSPPARSVVAVVRIEHRADVYRPL